MRAGAPWLTNAERHTNIIGELFRDLFGVGDLFGELFGDLFVDLFTTPYKHPSNHDSISMTMLVSKRSEISSLAFRTARKRNACSRTEICTAG